MLGPAVAAVALVASAACGDDDDAVVGAPATTASPAPESIDLEEGALVDVGGRSLFVRCSGSGDQVVVFEAGLTGDSRTWDGVVGRLPDGVRACVYDRANVGRSDEAPTPRTATDVVDDLEALLLAIDVESPYVLVGFSMGGIFSQLYASTHPDDVAGLVLVESNHPDEARQFEAHLTPEQIEADRAASVNPEGIDIFASLDEAGAPLPDVPLVVVTATGSGGDWPPGWDPALFDRLRAEQQADLSSLVPQGEQIFAEGSGHQVPADRPDVVVDAIERVLEQL